MGAQFILSRLNFKKVNAKALGKACSYTGVINFSILNLALRKALAAPADILHFRRNGFTKIFRFLHDLNFDNPIQANVVFRRVAANREIATQVEIFWPRAIAI